MLRQHFRPPAEQTQPTASGAAEQLTAPEAALLEAKTATRPPGLTGVSFWAGRGNLTADATRRSTPHGRHYKDT
ncbi:hypothetical protein EYF80_066713 [Liparis tanakae]|uniref:Uncharacterized protein n=1 Tax=Liparis tanakae TaxID=230148 RepID=A0A4Z2E332_9TELE|nr:hypothetical protein EYF80_066713 [Liparis tanakae]